MNREIMRALARELAAGGDRSGRRQLVVAVDVDTDPCGCARVRVAHVVALTDETDALAATMLLRREYDRRIGRVTVPLLTELEIYQ